MNDDLAQLISQALLRDQSGFLRRWDALRRREQGGRAHTHGTHVVGIAELRGQIQESIRRRNARFAARPNIWFPEELPVSGKRQEIAAAIRDHQVVVICGETGSGKTTQLPKICLDMGRGVGGLIGHTQPRRIAARSVAARIAEELNSKVGEHVGFKIRFSDNVADKNYIKLMTDGILLAETQGDRNLSAYDTLIIDEAHERSLNIDFLLGYLKQLLPRRPDLRIIITSATIDPERFSKHFNDCPIIMVTGRTYPVELRYRDPHPPALIEIQEDGSRIVTEEVDEEEPDLMQAIVRGVEEVTLLGPGDILVFLSGEREIREAASELEGAFGQRIEILPLFARLSIEEQQRIFSPSKKRRVVLATNVAETSLTVPGIRYVVDPGLARISRYAPRSKGGGVQRLPIEPVSQASANQRMGRCGRVAAGVCIRLYSEENFLARPLFTEPEVLRTNLAAVILQMKSLKLGAIEDFPFIDRPNARLIADGYQTLHELGALNKDQSLTDIGSKLARLPVDPCIARMVLAGAEQGVERDVLIIAAALCIQDPRERPLDKQEAADAAHLPFRDPDSDFLSFLKLWDWYHREAKNLSTNKLRRACKEKFLSYTRLREWHDVHEQLTEILNEIRDEERSTQQNRTQPGVPRVWPPQPASSQPNKMINPPPRRLPTTPARPVPHAHPNTKPGATGLAEQQGTQQAKKLTDAKTNPAHPPTARPVPQGHPNPDAK